MDEFKIIILVAHDKKDNFFWKRIQKGHIHKVKNTWRQKFGLNLKLQLIMNKKNQNNLSLIMIYLVM